MQDVSEIKHIKIQVDANLQWLRFSGPLASIWSTAQSGGASSGKCCQKVQQAQAKGGSFSPSGPVESVTCFM